MGVIGMALNQANVAMSVRWFSSAGRAKTPQGLSSFESRLDHILHDHE
jgi:hypothetical protein